MQDTSDDRVLQEKRKRVLQLISTSLDNILYAAVTWKFKWSEIIQSPRENNYCSNRKIFKLLKYWNLKNRNVYPEVDDDEDDDADDDEDEDEDEDDNEDKEEVVAENEPPTHQASS